MTHGEGEGEQAAGALGGGVVRGGDTDTESAGAGPSQSSAAAKAGDADQGKDLKRKALDRSESSFVVGDAKRLRDSASVSLRLA